MRDPTLSSVRSGGQLESFDRSTQLRKLDQLVLALSEVGHEKRSWGPGASVARSGSAERNPAREGSTSPSGDDVLHCLHAEHRRQRRALLRGSERDPVDVTPAHEGHAVGSYQAGDDVDPALDCEPERAQGLHLGGVGWGLRAERVDVLFSVWSGR